ncbi:uncharacterized protein FYW61_003778 [Anableps anableps]
MCSVEPLRQFIRERLTAAAEEIFTQLEKTIVQYEEELDRQRRLLDLTWRPRTEQNPAEPPEHPDPKETSTSLGQELPEPGLLEVKEEQNQPDFRMVTGSDEVQTEPELNRYQLVSLGPENQNQDGAAGRFGSETRTGVEEGPSDAAAQTAEKSVRCDVCGKAFKHRYEMKIHRRTHTGERPFSCNICSKSFMRSSGLAVHMRIHTGHKPYSCRSCGKRFTQLSSLNYHRRTHSDLRLQEEHKAGERSSSLDREEPEPPRMKEEEEELSVVQDGEQLVLKQEAEIFMVTLDYDEGEKTGPEPVTGRVHSQNSPEHQTLDRSCQEAAGPGPQNRPNRTRHGTVHGAVQKSPALQGPIGSEKSVKCDICGKAYKHNYEMKAHRRVHTGERPFSCRTCGKGFMRSSGLAVHMRIHTGQRPYSCRTCGKSFTQLNSLNYHRGTHLDLRLQEEHKAGERSSSLDREEPEPPRMKEEEEELSVVQDGEQLVLKQEAEIFMVTLDYDEGEKTGPDTGHVLFQNSDNQEGNDDDDDDGGGEGCSSDRQLESIRTRTENGPGEVDISSPSVDWLAPQMERSVRCDICGKVFKHNYEMKIHERIHTGERPFPCQTCGKKFRRRSGLTVHLRSHTGKRPYSCRICSKSFTQRNNFSCRMRRHSGEKPFNCGSCGRS